MGSWDLAEGHSNVLSPVGSSRTMRGMSLGDHTESLNMGSWTGRPFGCPHPQLELPPGGGTPVLIDTRAGREDARMTSLGCPRCLVPVGLGAWSPQDQDPLEPFAKRKMARPLGHPLTWREKCEVGIPRALVGFRLLMGWGPSQAAKTRSYQEGGHCLGEMGAGPAPCYRPTSKREKLRHRDWK